MSDKLTLSAGERITSLLDDASFVEIGSEVTARTTDFNENSAVTPKDGVITGYGLIDGRLTFVYSQDVSVFGGAIGEMHAKKISAIYNMAMKVGAPVVGLIDCAGLRLQEATDSLHSFGALFRKSVKASGVIPQITAIFGNCGGGAGVLAALSDFTYMVEGSKLFVNSPNAIKGNYEEKCDTSSAAYVSKNTSLVDGTYKSDAEALLAVRNLVSILPANNMDEAVAACEDDLNRTIPGIDASKDDARKIATDISDDCIFVETKADFGKDIVTGFIKLNGATVAVIANQVSESKGLISSDGASKAASFVSFADSFNIPVLTLTAAKGFVASFENEKTIAKESARLTAAFAEATVPKVNVVVGDAFGSAYIIMNSKSIGADIAYAWPTAKIGVTDPKVAAEIMYADDINSADDKTAAIKAAADKINESQSSALAAARRGYIDDIIEPDATRKRLIAAFDMLATKREDSPYKKHMAF
ncbi:Acetyl-CoA carboxylase, carboxyltransferase component [Lachnospiraceae bacterium]|nr:Acetyl-CoA carboxylase, carboxyltransferase component [Lachnospiraceae bacterium]